MPQLIHQVDAFTNRPFAGNPAAVCVLERAADADWMQRVAAEMNLSETAFLAPRAEGYDLRWFTPTVEVPLCGHATLASAHVLWETGLLDAAATARFHTASGVLTAVREGDWIALDFPARHEVPASAPPELLSALNVRPDHVCQNEFQTYLVELASAAEVRAVTPDFAALGKIPMHAVIVTSRADEPDCDFVSRFFAPAVGINEDPVTRSEERRVGKECA